MFGAKENARREIKEVGKTIYLDICGIFFSIFFYKKNINSCRGLFCIVRWAGLSSTVMSPSILDKGVETNPAVAQLGLVCAQTMSRLPGVCLR